MIIRILTINDLNLTLELDFLKYYVKTQLADIKPTRHFHLLSSVRRKRQRTYQTARFVTLF